MAEMAGGAKGFKITQPEEFLRSPKKALEISGPVLIEIPIDYRDNRARYENIHLDIFH